MGKMGLHAALITAPWVTALRPEPPVIPGESAETPPLGSEKV